MRKMHIRLENKDKSCRSASVLGRKMATSLENKTKEKV